MDYRRTSKPNNGGQINPIISIIIDDNINNKITITITTTTITIIKISKHSTERFSAPFSQVKVEKSVHINCSLPASRAL